MGRRVLIVEDEGLVAWSLEALVGRLGHELVGTAASSAQALKLAARTPPDIALVDLNLVDGRTGLTVSRELADWYGTVVIAVTGNADCVQEGRDGVQRVVAKPYTDDMIRDVLQWAAKKVRAGGRGEASHRSRVETAV